MNIQFREISLDEFKELNFPLLFESNLGKKSFGLIVSEKINYKFYWQSTVNKPIIKLIKDNEYSIGIDLNFVIIDINTSKILFKIYLDYFFYDTIIKESYIYLISELEIIVIDKYSYVVKNIISLPDFYESIEFKENGIVIKCTGNNRIKINK